MKSIGKYLSERFATLELIECQFIDVYAYIFDFLFNLFVYHLSLVIIGILLHRFVLSLIYAVITCFLRSISGGYHAKGRLSCYILSYSIFLVYLMVCKFTYTNYITLNIFAYFVNWILILGISPVENPNKLLSSKVRIKLRNFLYIIFSLTSIFTISLLLLNYNVQVYSLNISLTICTIGLYAGYFSNRIRLK